MLDRPQNGSYQRLLIAADPQDLVPAALATVAKQDHRADHCCEVKKSPASLAGLCGWRSRLYLPIPKVKFPIIAGLARRLGDRLGTKLQFMVKY